MCASSSSPPTSASTRRSPPASNTLAGVTWSRFDVDLQCDPADIPRLIEPLTRGYDLVSGIRLNRQDPAGRRFFSRLTTSLVTRLAGVPLHDIGCPLNAFTDDVARSLAAFGELRRFLKPLAVRVARRVTEVDVQHRPRPTDRKSSSYSTNGLVRLFMDFFVNALGDVFAWVFLIASALALALVVAAFVAAGRCCLRPRLVELGGQPRYAGRVRDPGRHCWVSPAITCSESIDRAPAGRSSSCGACTKRPPSATTAHGGAQAAIGRRRPSPRRRAREASTTDTGDLARSTR